MRKEESLSVFEIMKKEHTNFYDQVLDNIRKIMNDRGLTQVAIGEIMGAGESSISKIFSGNASLTIDHLANLASGLSLSVIDILNYSDKKKIDNDPVEAILQIKLKKDKKDQVLKLIFGENNIDILNK